ncbi:MAG: hypothetical protein AAB592_01985 [Patescibacteria group bacterium]
MDKLKTSGASPDDDGIGEASEAEGVITPRPQGGVFGLMEAARTAALSATRDNAADGLPEVATSPVASKAVGAGTDEIIFDAPRFVYTAQIAAAHETYKRAQQLARSREEDDKYRAGELFRNAADVFERNGELWMAAVCADAGGHLVRARKLYERVAAVHEQSGNPVYAALAADDAGDSAHAIGLLTQAAVESVDARIAAFGIGTSEDDVVLI